MKNFIFSSRPFVRVVVPVFLALTLIGCGFVISVPWIRNADNNQVVNIGDSIFAFSGEIQDILHSYAGKTFRRYATSGAEITGGSLAPSIVRQYGIAKWDNPNIHTILMDGGGNDILLPAIAFDPHDCKTQWYEGGRLSNSCKSLIDDIYVDTVNLLNQMAGDGVGKVIFQGYYYTKNTWLMKLYSLKEAIDYGDTRLAQACAYSAVDCTFIDPRPVINDEDVKMDAIHPKFSGSQKIADLVWPVIAPRL